MGEDITQRFDHIEVTSDGQTYIEEFREHFKEMALHIEECTEPGRARAVALTELESAQRAVNRAVAEANRQEEN